MSDVAFGVFIVLLMVLYTGTIMFVLYPIVDRYQNRPNKKGSDMTDAEPTDTNEPTEPNDTVRVRRAALMDPNLERVAALIEELRTSNRKQGTGYLHKVVGDEHLYCCLGVATELSIQQGCPVRSSLRNDLGEEQEPTNSFYDYQTDGEISDSGLLLHTVADWYGFGLTRNPSLVVPAELRDRFNLHALYKYAATSLNDTFGLTFAQIADCFELTYFPEKWPNEPDYYATHDEQPETD
jgi:hypothetical protein